MAYYSHRIGVPYLGEYEVVFDTDSIDFGGSGFIHTQRPAVSKEEKEIAATENDNQIDDEIKDCNLETNTEVETGTNNEAEKRKREKKEIREFKDLDSFEDFLNKVKIKNQTGKQINLKFLG